MTRRNPYVPSTGYFQALVDLSIRPLGKAPRVSLFRYFNPKVSILTGEGESKDPPAGNPFLLALPCSLTPIKTFFLHRSASARHRPFFWNCDYFPTAENNLLFPPFFTRRLLFSFLSDCFFPLQAAKGAV